MGNNVSHFEIDSAKLAAMCEHALGEIKSGRVRKREEYIKNYQNMLDNSWWNRLFKTKHSAENALSHIKNNWTTEFDFYMSTADAWRSHEEAAKKLLRSSKYTKTIFISVDDFNAIEYFNDSN